MQNCNEGISPTPKQLSSQLSMIAPLSSGPGLFPLSYLIHIAEEYWGGEGYPAYIFKLRGVHMSTTRFLVAQSVGFFLVTIGVLIARRLKFLPMMLVILGSVVAVNALTHTVTALSYVARMDRVFFLQSSFGVRSACATIIHFKSRIRKQKQYWIAIAIGVGINVVVGILTMRGARVI